MVYNQILGFNALTEQIDGTSDNSHLGRILSDIFGANLGNKACTHDIQK